MSDAPAPVIHPVRPFYWSVRRELWEHRAFWIAPLAIVAVSLVGFLFGTIGLPRAVHAAASVAGAGARKAVGLIAIPYVFVAIAVVMTGLVVAVFYCLGALHAERRDRSLLFWKSLPVSDLKTVLAKASLPIVVLPVIQIVSILAAHLAMLGWSLVVVLANGADLGVWWAHVPIPQMWLMLLHGLPFIALWYAPIYGWFIMVSAWARRAPYLWAIAPPLVLGLVERLALGTTTVWRWLALRVVGVFAGAFGGRHPGGTAPHAATAHAAAADVTSWTGPHLWIGLVLAVVFLAAAIRLRRSSDPI